MEYWKRRWPGERFGLKIKRFQIWEYQAHGWWVDPREHAFLTLFRDGHSLLSPLVPFQPVSLLEPLSSGPSAAVCALFNAAARETFSVALSSQTPQNSFPLIPKQQNPSNGLQSPAASRVLRKDLLCSQTFHTARCTWISDGSPLCLKCSSRYLHVRCLILSKACSENLSSNFPPLFLPCFRSSSFILFIFFSKAFVSF